MKTFRTLCLALVALAIIKVTCFAAAKDPTAIYKAGEVQLGALAYTDTDDLEDFEIGGGIALTYWHWQNFGAGLEVKTLSTGHAFFDTIGANLSARLPLKESTWAPFGRVGFDWNAEAAGNPATRNEFDLYVGAGIEKRFKHGISASVEARVIRDWEFHHDERYQLLTSISKAF